MSENDSRNDAEFVAGLMRRLPTTPVPSSLESRLLADFDRVAKADVPSRRFRRWRDALWPGAPLWQPASLFALSLAIGLIAGTLVPTSTQSATNASDQTITADDTAPALDLYKDL